jgi:hypothetical protein
MSRFKQITIQFLQEIHSTDISEWLQELKFLSEEIEEKFDPDPIELQIVGSVYQLLENFETIENLIKEYKKDSLPSEKLSTLYDKKSSGTTDILFD